MTPRGPVLLASALLCGGACASPDYAGDAGDVDRDAAAGQASDGQAAFGGERVDASRESSGVVARDGGQVADPSALPAWARPLLGRYAGRRYSFAQDSLLGTRSRVRDFMLVDFVQLDDGTLQLVMLLCDSFAEGDAAELRFVHPERSVARRSRVLLGDQSWSTEPRAAVEGYTREAPARCNGNAGSWVNKDPKQTWIAGDHCICPTSLDAPPVLEDCRVLDGDGDGHPGVTFAFHPLLPPFGNANVYAATLDQSTYVRGEVRADRRHRAQLAIDSRAHQLDCDQLSCVDISATPTRCPPERNVAEFVYLGEPSDQTLTCATVLAQASELFPTALPERPSCP